MKSLFQFLCLITVMLNAGAQTNLIIPLWPNGAPGALGNEAKDIPTLTVYLPPAELATGAAMVICPGGSYANLAEHEGSHYARWFNSHGIAAFVLKYRLGSQGYHHPAMINDASRAIRTVRARASEWSLDPTRVGIIGSSAGGHLASTTMTHWDAGNPNAEDVIERVSSRPDLAILCYPVISLHDERITHKGSRKNLIGTNQPPELLQKLSAELQVNSNTPPAFIWSTMEDTVVPVENSMNLAAALRRVGVPFDLHVYERGPHGLGLGNRTYDEANFHPWTRDAEYWLRQRKFAR